MKTHKASLRTFVYFCALISLVHCGRTSKLKVQNRASSGLTDTSSDGTGSATPVDRLVCQLSSNTSQMDIPVRNGQFLPGYLPPPIGFNVLGTINGVAKNIQIPAGALPPPSFTVVGAPTVQANSSLQFSLRPNRLGALPVSFQILGEQGESATCQATVTLRGVEAPELTVNISADGSTGNVATPLTSGQAVMINWASSGDSCVVKRNGQVIPSYTGPFGEFPSGQITNPSPNPILILFEAICSGGPLNETKTAFVKLTVNPGVSAHLAFAGSAARNVKLISPGAVDLTWSSSFASRGCVLGDGENSQPVAPNGAIHIENITQSVTWSLSCWDSLAMRVSSLNIQIVDPAIASFTANGVAGTLVKPNGGDITFAWNARDVTGCTFNPGALAVAPNGSRTVAAASITADTTYTLSCNSDFGAKTSTVTVDVVAAWFNAASQECGTYCNSLGKTNLPSPEGITCASGENRPPSGAGIINYVFGCWNGCNGGYGAGAASSGSRCYHPTQKRDNDGTDTTVACFCG